MRGQAFNGVLKRDGETAAAKPPRRCGALQFVRVQKEKDKMEQSESIKILTVERGPFAIFASLPLPWCFLDTSAHTHTHTVCSLEVWRRR